jgi:3-isopropylmalate/(R)-2-methylmalate dehydratase large subunit
VCAAGWQHGCCKHNYIFILTEEFVAKTLFEKVWDAHVVAQDEGAPVVLYIDAHLIHEVTSPQAFTGLRERGLKVRRPDKTFATMDHAIPTTRPDIALVARGRGTQVQADCARTARTSASPCTDIDSPIQGIVHVIGPELGAPNQA